MYPRHFQTVGLRILHVFGAEQGRTYITRRPRERLAHEIELCRGEIGTHQTLVAHLTRKASRPPLARQIEPALRSSACTLLRQDCHALYVVGSQKDEKHFARTVTVAALE